MAGRRDDGHRHRPVHAGRHADGHLDRHLDRAIVADDEHLVALGVISERQVDAGARRRDDVRHEASAVNPDCSVGQLDAALDRGVIVATVSLRCRRHDERGDRHGRAELDDGRVEAPTRRVEWWHTDRALLNRQPGAVVTDEADRPARRQRADGHRGVVEDLRRDEAAGDDRRERAVRPAAGQRADVGTSGPLASMAAAWLGAIGPRGRVDARSGRERMWSSSGAVRCTSSLGDAPMSTTPTRRALSIGCDAIGTPGGLPRGQERTPRPYRGVSTATPRCVRLSGTASASSTIRPESSVMSVSSGPRLIRKSASRAELLMKAASSPGTPSLSPRMMGVLPEPTGSRVAVGVAK